MPDVDKAAEKVEKIIKLADKGEAGCLAVKEYEAEELASDSDDEKRIRKTQEKALKKKKQNAFKKSEKNKAPLSAHTSRAADDRSLFRGMLLALSFFFFFSTWQAGALTLPALQSCVFVLCFSVLEKENDFPSYERSEGEGKCIFLRKFSVSMHMIYANTSCVSTWSLSRLQLEYV